MVGKVRVSDMARAKETAQLIAKELGSSIQVDEPDPLLNEALPSPMIPIRPDIEGAEEEIDANHDRIERAFRKYIYRSTNEEDNEDEFEIIVCHGNVIRYFFCRALQLPPEAWLRMSIFNCSLTYLMVRPTGTVSARMLGDIGHLSYDESSFSGYHGLKW
jgi:serine/threonine-protein phosphatase PGAM5